ncbi:hypothetical protein QWY75_13480 [Pontixanthobacter aestiaquae]|uniref:Uncharacterized protein n=1 Tax=Pontixanthobacter aestiaquae TaxID=1509367 RepID=A0A844Z3Y4_9SPHN|nr:hypothetical protein [Pontixanthobacter aestiaquae]MDN3647217.1 hypothetical protein [Pontixanthobacter aestiaquae]MXO81807.1 hypothetical protein [Pontixanthobacter aestiaquae]
MDELNPIAEREVLEILEQALEKPESDRRRWLAQKLKERELVGQRVEDLLAFAECHLL